MSADDNIALVRRLYDEGINRHDTAAAAAFYALDAKNHLVGLHLISKGRVSSSYCSPREIIQAALLHNAAGIILVHNHPSGDANPITDDVACTRKIKEACTLMDMELLDHIVVADGLKVSMRERGLM